MNKRQLQHISTLLLWLVATLAGLRLDHALAEPTGNREPEWNYTFRSSDSIQKIGKELLSDQYSWTDLVQHNRLNNVASLPPGTIIRVPMHWLRHQPKPAKTVSITGTALIKSVTDAHFKVLQENMLIQVGDEVATQQGSSVLIEFADGSSLRLEENSNLVFNKLSHFGLTGMVDMQLRLNKGVISTEVTPLEKGSRYEITTPSAVAAVRGTKFRVQSSDQSTTVEVTDGLVNVEHAHGSEVVAAGEGVRVQRGSAMIERHKLDPAPEPQFANTHITDLPTTLTWKAKQAAKEFRYQLTDKGNNHQLVQSATVPQPEVTLDKVGNGDYQIALRAISADGIGGMDAKSELKVDIAAISADLVAPLDGSIIDDARPQFSWTFNGNDQLAKLELSRQPDFSSLLTRDKFEPLTSVNLDVNLAPGEYYWRVQSLSDTGQETASSTRKLMIRGELEPIQILSVNYTGDQVGLFWNSVEQASGYVLQISDDDNFTTILQEETLGKPSAHLKLTPGKHYYARVKGVGNELYKANFSPTKELFVNLPSDEQ